MKFIESTVRFIATPLRETLLHQHRQAAVTGQAADARTDGRRQTDRQTDVSNILPVIDIDQRLTVNMCPADPRLCRRADEVDFLDQLRITTERRPRN